MIEIDLSSITLNWFLAIFIDSVPFETLLRIWDCFLLEGNKVLFRYSCALLYMHKYGLLEQRDTISMFKQLKNAAKGTYDVDGLTKVRGIN
jgi:TBC1 domain family member 2B